MSSYNSLSTTISEIVQHYGLGEEELLQEVTSQHLGDLCRDRPIQWQQLSDILLENSKTAVNDIERTGKSEPEKRRDFFKLWQSQKGSSANYEALIRALLRIQCRGDAEYVCKQLLQLREERTFSLSSIRSSECSSLRFAGGEMEEIKKQLKDKDRRIEELEAKLLGLTADKEETALRETAPKETAPGEIAPKPQETEELAAKGKSEQERVPKTNGQATKESKKQEYRIEIGSGNLKGAFGFGRREDYTYPVPQGTVAISFVHEDRSPNSFNLIGANGEATLHWKLGDEEARVHAWVNGAVGEPNEVAWTVTAVLLL